MMDPIRRNILATGAAATAMAAATGVFAQQAGQGGAPMSFYEKGAVRIHYEVAGSGFPLLLIAGGGLNSVISGLARGPFDPIAEFKGEYRCVAADLRNANPGQSSGPLEIDRPWDSHTDDQLGVMDHLGIDKFMVMGFCIGGPLVWNLLKRAPDRVVAAVLAQPSGFRPEMPNLSYENNMTRLGSGIGQAPARHHHGHGRQIPDQDVSCQSRLRLDRDTRFRAQLPDARADPPR
jgi:pimeloyl-ACP methyl ester carboxylesterase